MRAAALPACWACADAKKTLPGVGLLWYITKGGEKMFGCPRRRL